MKIILEKIQSQIAENLYPGASLALYRQGKWQSYYLGYSQEDQATEPGLIYDVASVSKVLGVATVAIQLLAEGVLDLDQPLQTYYPVFADKTVTIRQLLTHTTGIDPFIPNRDRLSADQLVEAINQIMVTPNKAFLYTDINFLLLGFMLEHILEQSLDKMFEERVFGPLGMRDTSFGPRPGAVPTLKGISNGLVHDPKARVLGCHAGSAGIFSTLEDLKVFCQYYLSHDFGCDLETNYGHPERPRSLGWNLEGDWLDHTGYTGPFIMVNRVSQEAVVFLTNRTYDYDDRPLWIEKRAELMAVMKGSLGDEKTE